MPEEGMVAPQSASAARTSDPVVDVGETHLSFTGVGVPPARLAALRHRLRDWALQTGLSADQVDDLVLAAYEALTNATEHAYPPGTGEVSLLATRTTDDQVVVTVQDRGQWRPPPADPGLRGRGLLLIRRLAHRVDLHHDHNGTKVQMHWQLLPAAP